MAILYLVYALKQKEFSDATNLMAISSDRLKYWNSSMFFVNFQTNRAEYSGINFYIYDYLLSKRFI